MNIQDMTSGITVKLRGEKLEAFEEQLSELVIYEIDEAEAYLDSEIRPRISENYDYYNLRKPEADPEGSSYVDPTTQSTVDHAVAHCLDAFTDSDTVEVVPQGNNNLAVNKVINAVVNDVLDSENDRFRLYSSFFKDTFIAGASLLKPYVTEDIIIDKKYFERIHPEEVAIRQMNYVASGEWDDVEITIMEEVTEEEELVETIPQNPLVPELAGTELTHTVVNTYQSGFFTMSKKEKTIKIEQIPSENFLIAKQARSIETANFVGHKAMIPVGDLLAMGFDEDKVQEVAEMAGSEDDAVDNIASQSRREHLIGPNVGVGSRDWSMKQAELFEVYIRTGLESSLDEEDVVVAPKLYQVFMANNVLLGYQEVDDIPYVGTSPYPTPFSFWGLSLVDKTKHIQRALTGIQRQEFAYNDLASKPRFMYDPSRLINTRDLMNNKAGAGIAVKDIHTGTPVVPLQMFALSGTNQALMANLGMQREANTGVSYTGQSMLGDVLKAGGSTISASMVLTEQQKMLKTVIQTLLEGCIKPLVERVYNLLRENFNAWEISVNGEQFIVNPNDEWPRLREVRVKTPLGKTSKLEKSQSLMNLYTTLTTGQGEAAKLVSAPKLRQLLEDTFMSQDIPDAAAYIASDEEIMQKDMMGQQMAQMQQMMQQMQQQLALLTKQNEVLNVTASQMAQEEMVIKKEDLNIRKAREQREAAMGEAKMMDMADNTIIKQEKAEADMMNMADKIDIEYDKLELDKMLAEKEAQLQTNLYTV